MAPPGAGGGCRIIVKGAVNHLQSDTAVVKDRARPCQCRWSNYHKMVLSVTVKVLEFWMPAPRHSVQPPFASVMSLIETMMPLARCSS